MILPLRIDRLSFAAGGRTIIEDVSLELAGGPSTIILGANGAGKSVLMRLMHGLLSPTAGRVSWNSPGRQAMVFQRPVMLRRSALANVAYALKVSGLPQSEKIAMEALEKNTARLPTVEIVPPHDIIGRSTIESIQSGLFFGTRAMVLGLTRELRKAAFGAESATTIGTGGFARLFEREKMFDALVPDLVLLGLHRALEMNADGSRRWTPQDMEPDH